MPGFVILPSTGTVKPDETEKIEVQCTPLEAIAYEDAIVMHISEPRKCDINGRHLNLHAKGSEPHLDFKDIDKVFREQYIVETVDDFIQGIGACCAYIKSESVLYFKNACVRKTSSARIYLKNIGDVIANVVLKVDNKQNYMVSPRECIIEAYNTETVTIAFTPDSINVIEGKLEISYNATANSKYVLKLMGESCIPRVVLLEPTSKDHENQSLILFPPTFLGEQNEHNVSIKNVGPIGARVILELCGNTEEVLSLQVAEDTRQYLNIADFPAFVDVKYSTLVNLPPSKIGNFRVFFKPTSDKKITALLKIHTVDNIFEIIKIELMGIGFHHEIRFDLPVSYYMSSSKSSPSFSYDLDFGFTSLNRILNKTFTITNLSFNSTYKFEICSNCAVMFVPSVGHLKPMVTKTIVASFCTNEPLALEKVNINCHVVRIEYVEPSAADISWDDRQEMMVWKLPSQTESGDLNDKDGSKTKLVSHTEPEIIEKSEHDFIKLFITGKADYAMYITTMKEIVFPNTFLNEQSTVEFEVINDGTVPLQITWAIKDFEEDDVQRPFTPKTESLRSHDCSLRSTCSSTSLSSLFSSTTPTGHPASTFPEMHVQKKNPFRVIPESDTIPVHSGRRFQVTFAPIEASLYTLQLISNIPSLSPTLSEIEVALMGKAILPEYYFELEYTDYLNSRPHIPNCNNEDIANCKIIEFLSIGVGVVCTRKFNFVNPDKDDTTFRLSPKGENNHFTYFSCKSNTGIVKGSKKCEICFTFTPQELGAYEEFYQFHVEGKNPTTFLLAGQCREPHVYFKTPFITIEPTLLHVAKTVTVELKNDEYQECPFRICKGSLLDGNSKRVLEVIPMSGNVAPRSETSVKIIFNAEEPGPVNFDLRCTVRQIKEPLHLGISANCLTVVSKVFYTDVAGDLIILKADEDNYMNFKNVMLKNPSTQKISIVNEGYIGFYYTWHVDKSTTNPFVDITIEEEKGFLAGGTFNDSVLTLTPQRKSAIHDMKIILQISYGPKYVIKINAIAGKPLFKFSFVNYDFGHCLVQKNKSKYYGTLLTCKNYDTRPLVIENLFDTNANLSVNFKSATIAPNSLVTIPIYFHPLTVGKHHFAIPFDVSTSKYIVNVNGNAVKLNIQLFDIRDKFIDIGSMKVGSIKKRAIQVLNKTPTEMDVYFALWDHLPMRKRPQEKAEMILKLPEVPEPVVKKGNGKIKKYKGSEDKKKGKSKEEGNTEKSSKSTKKDKKKLKEDEDRHSRSGSDQLFGPKVNLTEPPKMDMSQYVKISPKTSIHMLPDKKYEIIVEFNAKQRLEEFVEKIFYEVQDYALPLCVVKGSYVAPEFSLDKNMLTFANVVLGCHRDMYILLQNTGDLKGRFKWVVDRNDQFEIHPMDGVIMPKTVMKICITYRPKVMQCQLILKSKCIINGVTHLPLTIVANSVNWPNPAEHLTFFCPVRTETSQTVTLYNKRK
ncbi:unnamed protein product [Acanthoscelides obtectus]|uniref:Hydrocephalus-inducing protein n=1 Tax=Acanthoscelides obtectus TaxID=200917 RepID=A0A9P0M2J9_ACAOB|nr:unnamed protein product [Acanthoscelides obtectus]CAK1634545.1 Hydrocephalus-inducing protein homolog [Acanthoscelides obtectus]